MNAVYNHRQQKLFTNALSCLSRFGDKLSIRCSQPEETSYALRLSAINPAGSAFCAFRLFPDFFESYELNSEKRRTDLVLNIRTLQNVLKTQLNKKLERCEFILIEEDTESRLAIRLHSFNGVTKTHKLTFEEQRGLFPSTPDEVSKVVMDAKTVQGLLDHFGSRSNGEIALFCKKADLIIKSRNEDFVDRNSKMGRSVWTEVKVDSKHFKTYKVKDEVELTFALREFKAAIALADHLALPLELTFSLAGAPLVIKVQCPAMVAEIFIATSPASEEEESQVAEARDASVPTHRPSRQTNETPEEEPANLLDEGQQGSQREESEFILSGRNAADDHGGPLQSTAPVGNPIQSGQAVQQTPVQSRKSPLKQREGLFLGQSSSQGRSHDTMYEERSHDSDLEDEMERAVKEAEMGEQQRQSQARPVQTTQEALSDLMMDSPNKGALLSDDDEEEDVQDEYGGTDEEEIPSTQEVSSSKRAKYIPLF